jgi:hypothetical protein
VINPFGCKTVKPVIGINSTRPGYGIGIAVRVCEEGFGVLPKGRRYTYRKTLRLREQENGSRGAEEKRNSKIEKEFH